MRGWNFTSVNNLGTRGRLDVVPGTRVVDRLGGNISVSSRPIVLSERGGNTREALRDYVREAPRDDRADDEPSRLGAPGALPRPRAAAARRHRAGPARADGRGAARPPRRPRRLGDDGAERRRRRRRRGGRVPLQNESRTARERRSLLAGLGLRARPRDRAASRAERPSVTGRASRTLGHLAGSAPGALLRDAPAGRRGASAGAPGRRGPPPARSGGAGRRPAPPHGARRHPRVPRLPKASAARGTAGDRGPTCRPPSA